MTLNELPHLNATLNTVATVLLLSGWFSIKAQKKTAHVCFMVLALLVSAAFLTSYLTYHFQVGDVKFQGKGWIRFVYFPMLISHILLAVGTLPLVIMTVIPALRQRFDRHKKLARWTFPVWLYVSVTGVLVYFFCYVWYP